MLFRSSTNNDVLVESYVDNNKVYVVASNLIETPEEILIQKNGLGDASLQQVKVKQLYLDGNAPKLEEQVLTSDIKSIELKPEATVIIEYSYDADIIQALTAEEQKYFAADFLQPITQNSPVTTQINSVAVPEFADVKLRLVVGRDHGASLTPQVRFNGELLTSQLALMGDEQSERDRFFGLLEFDVPFSLLDSSNTVAVTFADDGGHLASVNLKVLSIDESARPTTGAVEGVLISAQSNVIAVGGSTQVDASVYPYFATNKALVYSSSNESLATVDSQGVVTGLSAGNVQITATSEDGGFTDSVTIEVETPTVISIGFDDKSKYLNTEYVSGETMQVSIDYDAGTGNTVAADFGGIDYFFRHLNSGFGVISDIKVQDASVIGKQRGTSTVSIPLDGLVPSAELENGEFYFLFVRFKNSAQQIKNVNAFPIQVIENQAIVAPSLAFDDAAKYRDGVYTTDGTLDVTAHYEAGSGDTVSDVLGGVKFFLRELNASFVPVNDLIAFDDTAIDQQTGTASASFSLEGLTPSSALPEGNFYYLFAIFESSDGSRHSVDGVFPITIEQGAVEPAFAIVDANGIKTTQHIVGQTLDVSVDFEMGTGKTVSPVVGGIRYFLRELAPGFVVVKDTIVEDDSVIGLQSGTSSASIPLAGLTPTDELPEGHFYFLFVLVEDSDGARQNSLVFPLDIIKLQGDFDADGDVDRNDIMGLMTAIQKREQISMELDLNEDGAVNILDVRAMMALCTRAGCATE